MNRQPVSCHDFTPRTLIECIVAAYGEGCEFTSTDCSVNALPPYSNKRDGERSSQFFNRYTLDHDMRELFTCREVELASSDGSTVWYNDIIDCYIESDNRPQGKGWTLYKDNCQEFTIIQKRWALKDAKAAMAWVEEYEAAQHKALSLALKDRINRAMDSLKAEVQNAQSHGFTDKEILTMIIGEPDSLDMWNAIFE